MKGFKLVLAVAIAPATLLAQQTTQDSSSMASSAVVVAKVQSSANAAAAGLSAEARADLEVVLQKAKQHALPVQAIQNRVAEGLAKGASEAQIILAASALEARLEASQRAMVRAGREQPTSDEVQSGAGAMERGVTEAQLEALVEHTPSDRSLVVAFDVLSALAASGKPVATALAQVQAKLESRASDAALIAIAGTVHVHGNAGASGSASQSGSAAGSQGVAGGAVNGALQAGGSVTAKIGGIIK